MTELAIGDRVVISEAIDYGAGTQHWVGRKATVKKLHRRSQTGQARAVDLHLDGDPKDELLWFFVREIRKIDDE